jgi:hypothetical protein
MNNAMKICLICRNTIIDLVLIKYNKIKEKPIVQLGINKLIGLILKISKITSIEGSIIPKKSK